MHSRRPSGLLSRRRTPAQGRLDSAVVDQALDCVSTFIDALGRASSRVLLLDYDGTLAPFREDRAHAVPYDEVREAVQTILDTGRTRVVIVSGRSLESLRPLVAIEPCPELWGTHGWERLEPGRPPQLRPLPVAGAAALAEAARALGKSQLGDRLEVKAASVALHVRGLGEGEAEHLLTAARAAWEPLASKARLDLRSFDGGIELRAAGWNKGDAVRAVLAPEPAGTAAAYLGDDRTDEDAFLALRDVAEARRLVALSALVRGERRESAADAWLRPPGQLLEFLARWRKVTA